MQLTVVEADQTHATLTAFQMKGGDIQCIDSLSITSSKLNPTVVQAWREKYPGECVALFPAKSCLFHTFTYPFLQSYKVHKVLPFDLESKAYLLNDAHYYSELEKDTVEKVTRVQVFSISSNSLKEALQQLSPLDLSYAGAIPSFRCLYNTANFVLGKESYLIVECTRESVEGILVEHGRLIAKTYLQTAGQENTPSIRRVISYLLKQSVFEELDVYFTGDTSSVKTSLVELELPITIKPIPQKLQKVAQVVRKAKPLGAALEFCKKSQSIANLLPLEKSNWYQKQVDRKLAVYKKTAIASIATLFIACTVHYGALKSSLVYSISKDLKALQVEQHQSPLKQVVTCSIASIKQRLDDVLLELEESEQNYVDYYKIPYQPYTVLETLATIDEPNMQWHQVEYELVKGPFLKHRANRYEAKWVIVVSADEQTVQHFSHQLIKKLRLNKKQCAVQKIEEGYEVSFRHQ